MPKNEISTILISVFQVDKTLMKITRLYLCLATKRKFRASRSSKRNQPTPGFKVFEMCQRNMPLEEHLVLIGVGHDYVSMSSSSVFKASRMSNRKVVLTNCQPNPKVCHTTVWKFEDFSIIQILREINFGECRPSETAICVKEL